MKIREMITNSKEVVMSEIKGVEREEMEEYLQENISYLEDSLKNVIDSEVDEGIENLLLQKFLEDFETKIKYILREKFLWKGRFYGRKQKSKVV